MTGDSHSYLLTLVGELRAEIKRLRDDRNRQRRRAEMWSARAGGPGAPVSAKKPKRTREPW